MTRLRACWLLILLLLAGGAAQAQDGGRHMDVRLAAESGRVLPGGEVTLAFVMHPQPGWHGYWINPGDAGAPPRVRWNLPEGWRADPLLFPVPGRLSVIGLMNYVFDRDYALLATVHVPAGAELDVVFPLDARLDYLVCTDTVCVPETATATVQLTIGAPRGTDPAFDGYRAALPRPLGSEGRFVLADGRIRIAIPLPAAARLVDPYFFPATSDAIAHSAPQSFARSGDTLIVDTVAGPRAAALPAIDGVLRTGPGAGLALTARPGAVPAGGTPIAGSPAPAEAPGASLVWALLGAILGGLILNVMPCVFPILSLKALSLARAGETEAAARREALAYAAGVILTCLSLGGLLLALRAGGAAVGWAFQLQDPRVILLLMLLVTAIAFNLAGLFQLPMLGAGEGLTRRGGIVGAFFTGSLAAFIATPCTGPFMGAALGAALVLPAAGALAVFAGLGLGLALPFLALGFVPALRRLLPRPGRWMATLQRVLAIPMFLTALGLAWILGRQTGADGMAFGLLGALSLALGLWWLGRGGARWFAAALVLASLAPLAAIRAMPPAPVESPLGAEPFSEARLAGLRAARAPVFLYFTADWCLTCKVNERGALASAAVADSFRAHGVHVLVGDWTSGDAAIGRFLAAHGRSGVPLYLYYPPGREPETLPQLLTAARLTALADAPTP